MAAVVTMATTTATSIVAFGIRVYGYHCCACGFHGYGDGYIMEWSFFSCDTDTDNGNNNYWMYQINAWLNLNVNILRNNNNNLLIESLNSMWIRKAISRQIRSHWWKENKQCIKNRSLLWDYQDHGCYHNTSTCKYSTPGRKGKQSILPRQIKQSCTARKQTKKEQPPPPLPSKQKIQHIHKQIYSLQQKRWTRPLLEEQI